MVTLKYWLMALSILAAVSYSADISGEIQKLVVVWTRGLCLQNCATNLEREFRGMAGVEDVKMDQSSATAVLKWKEGVPFTFQALEAPLSKIGLSIEHIRVQVKGILSHDDATIWLTSSGDGTRFVLLGPVQPSLTGFTETYSFESYSLTPEKRATFINAEKQNMIATIDGPILMPETAPPLVLIAEKTQFEQQPEASSQTNN